MPMPATTVARAGKFISAAALMDIYRQNRPGSDNPSLRRAIENIGPQNVEQDPNLTGVMRSDDMGPVYAPGTGAAQKFASEHEISGGRDWDFTSKTDLRALTQKAIDTIKDNVSGHSRIVQLRAALNEAATANKEKLGDDPGIKKYIEIIKGKLSVLEGARALLAKGIEGGTLARTQKTLRVFRYETEVALAEIDPSTYEMEKGERAMRSLQNAFTFGVDNHVNKAALMTVKELENEIADLVGRLGDKMDAAGLGAARPAIPEGFSFFDTIKSTLELSHSTNDQIRTYRTDQAAAAKIRDMFADIVENGGERTVEFSGGVGLLLGLDLPKAVTLGVSLSGRSHITAHVKVDKPGMPLEVTFTDAKGGELKAQAKFGGISDKLELGAAAAGRIEEGFFVKRTYPTLDDFILDADRCRFATKRSVTTAIGEGIAWAFSSIGRIGANIGRSIGRRTGDIAKDNRQYLALMKDRGAINMLDHVLAKRANAVIMAESGGDMWAAEGVAGAKMSFAGLIGGYAGASARHTEESNVYSRAYVPLARTLRAIPDALLERMMRPGADGGDAPPVPVFHSQEAISAYFDELIDEARDKTPLRGREAVALAGEVRSLMISLESMQREGRISAPQADRLMRRFSNPEIRLPVGVFREYLMDGAGLAKLAKSRNFVSAELDLNLFTDWSDGLTKGIENPFGAVAANAAIGEMRHQIGLDTKIRYEFSSEKPANPGEDPRPWENTVKTTHEIEVSNSMPARVIIDTIAKCMENNGGPVQMSKGALAGNIALGSLGVGAAEWTGMAMAEMIPGFIAVKPLEAYYTWLENPKNVSDFYKFIFENASKPITYIKEAVEEIMKHPEEPLSKILGYIQNTDVAMGYDRMRTVRINFDDGKLSSVNVFTTTVDSFDVNVTPPSLGLGFTADMTYRVIESTMDHDILVNPPLTTLLSKAEGFLFADTGGEKYGDNTAMKMWLSRNFKAVSAALSPEGLQSETSRKVFDKVLSDSLIDTQLAEKMRAAHDDLMAMPAGTHLTRKEEFVDKAYDLLRLMAATYHMSDTILDLVASMGE